MSDHSEFRPSKLGEISRPRQWPTISQEVMREAGLHPVYGANGVIGFYNSYTHERPTVAITCRGSTCGEIHLTPEKSYITGNAMALDDLDRSRLDQRYLYHFLKRDGLKDCITGSAQPQIIGSALKDFLVWHPPLESQRTIAAILDTLDTQIQKTEALIAKLEKVKEGLLHDLLTRGIDENGQLRPSPEQALELYKDSPLGLIPREWRVASLGGVSEIVSGVTLGSKSGNSAWPLVPYLRVANVQDGYLDLSEIKLVRVNPDHIEKYRLHPGDVLMNEGGDFDKLGRGTLWRGEIELCVHQNHVFRVRTDGRVLDPYFLASFSASFAGKRYFVKSSKQSTNLASINSTQLKAFEVPLPSIEEQGVIVDKLQVMADRIEHEKSHLSKLAAHKSGLMDDLLTGRVRVTRLLDQAQAQGTTPA